MGLSISSMHVRRSIWIDASPDRVWEEFGSFGRVDAWFGRGHKLHELVLEPGGSVDLSVTLGGAARHFGGKIVVLEPGRELSFENNWQAPHAWPVPTFVTLRLSAVAEGTLVEFFHHGFDHLGPRGGEELAGYEAGWDMKHLLALRDCVASSATARRRR